MNDFYTFKKMIEHQDKLSLLLGYSISLIDVLSNKCSIDEKIKVKINWLNSEIEKIFNKDNIKDN